MAAACCSYAQGCSGVLRGTQGYSRVLKRTHGAAPACDGALAEPFEVIIGDAHVARVPGASSGKTAALRGAVFNRICTGQQRVSLCFARACV